MDFRTIDKKTVDVCYVFGDELNAVKKELSSKRQNLLYDQPLLAGQAFWARLLRRRIDRSYGILKGKFEKYSLIFPEILF